MKKQTNEHKKKRLDTFMKNGKNLGPDQDLAGARFGRLTVLGYGGRYVPPSGKCSQSLWLCECDCGNIKIIQQTALKTGRVVSCKCLNNEKARKLGLANNGENNGMFGKMSGPNNPNWNGGISSPRDMIANTEEYKRWRSEVFKQDNYTCRVCDKNGIRLEAHHVLSFGKFPEYRYDPENGLTLCFVCHKYASIPITRQLIAT